MNIREARPDDVTALLELGRLMHAESPYWSRLPFDAERTERTLRAVSVLVAEDDGRIVGGIGGTVVPHWSVDALVGCELFLFVHPSARGGTAAMRLIRALDAQFKSRGARLAQAGATTGVSDERVAALYERMGFERYGVGLSKMYERASDV